MRRYDDPVEVRRGMVAGAGGEVEGPEQFLWRGRLWKVSGVVGHWVETGSWWSSAGADAVRGGDDPGRLDPGRLDPGGEDVAGSRAGAPVGTDLVGTDLVGTDLVAEREVWRVQAARGMVGLRAGGGHGVFDLAFDWARGSWQLTRCLD